MGRSHKRDEGGRSVGGPTQGVERTRTLGHILAPTPGLASILIDPGCSDLQLLFCRPRSEQLRRAGWGLPGQGKISSCPTVSSSPACVRLQGRSADLPVPMQIRIGLCVCVSEQGLYPHCQCRSEETDFVLNDRYISPCLTNLGSIIALQVSQELSVTHK